VRQSRVSDSSSDSGESGDEDDATTSEPMPQNPEQPLKGCDLVGKLVKVWYQDPTPNYYLGMVLSFDKGTGGHSIQFKDGIFIRYLDNERSWYLVDQTLQEKLTKKLGLSVPGQINSGSEIKSEGTAPQKSEQEAPHSETPTQENEKKV